MSNYVAARSDSKVYDGTTSSSATPTITDGSLAPGDMACFTQSYDSANAGERTLMPAGSINDGNGGNNYSVTFVGIVGKIYRRAITVTAASATKVFDGTTSSSAVPTITGGSLAAGDTACFTQSFDTAAFGGGKTLTPFGCVNDGNSGNNYAVTFETASGEISRG
jgi:hypothetical protein